MQIVSLTKWTATRGLDRYDFKFQQVTVPKMTGVSPELVKHFFQEHAKVYVVHRFHIKFRGRKISDGIVSILWERTFRYMIHK